MNKKFHRGIALLLLLVIGVTGGFGSTTNARTIQRNQPHTQRNAPLAVSLAISGRWVDSNGNDHLMRNIPADIFLVNSATPLKSVTLGMDGWIVTTLPGSGTRSIYVRFYAKGGDL